MLRLKSLIWYLVLLSLAFPLGNVWAKQSKFNIDAVSDVTLDVVRFEACIDDTDECVIAGGPKQVNLLDLADGRVDFAKQVLLPDNTTELRLVLGESSTITVDGESFPLTVPSGQTSGLKLKGRKAFGKEGGFLSGLTLDLNLRKQLVVQAKKVRHKEKGRHGKKKVSYVYSYKLKPVIKVATAEVEALPENMAAVVALPDEDVTLTLGDDFSMQIPAGAVSEATIITTEEIKNYIEVLDPLTQQIIVKPDLASTFRLEPTGFISKEPLQLRLKYNQEALREKFTLDDLTIRHDGHKVATQLNTADQTVAGEIEHFSKVTISPYSGECTEENIGRELAKAAPVKYFDCEAAHGFPRMHVAVVDRVALADTYELRVIAHDSGDQNGTFITNQLEEFAKSYISKPIIAINGNTFSCRGGGNACEKESMEGSVPTRTTVINGILKQLVENPAAAPEVAMTLAGNGESNRIPIQYLTRGDIESNFQDSFGVTWQQATDQRQAGNLEGASRAKPGSAMYWMIGSHQASRRNNTCPFTGDTGKWYYDSELSELGYGDDEIIFLVSQHGEKFNNYQDGCDAVRIFGASDAVLMDGGGSAQLVVDGELKNDVPADARFVANAVALVSKALPDVSVSPLKATLNEPTIFTVIGQDLPSSLAFSFEGCEDVTLLSSIATSRQFRCTPSVAGEKNGQVRYKADGTLLYNFTVTVSEEPVVVSSVMPTKAVLGESTTFIVSGQNLPPTLEFSLEDCLDVTPPWVPYDTEQHFSCTPSYSTGLKALTINESPGGDFLYGGYIDFVDGSEPASCPSGNGLYCGTVDPSLNNNTLYDCQDGNYEVYQQCANGCETMPAGTSDRCKDVALPIVNSVTPTEAVLNQPTTFTVSGQNLPSTLAFWIGECENVTSLGGTSTSMKFSCTPSWTLGTKNGVVKDQPGGTTLKEFTVDVADAPSDDDLVLKEVRVTANGTLYAGSTATYTAVADLAENITTGSLPKPGNVVKTIEVTDECSWLVTPGMYADSLGGGLVQAESSAAGQEVKVKCTYYHSPSNLNLTGTLSVVVSGGNTTSPVVYSVTPNEAVLGESTVFTVSGQDLPSTLAFWIEECENLTSLGGGSTSRQFRCTPTWTTGWKDGVVKDEPNGNVLYNFNVDVADAPVTSPVVYSVTPTDAVLDQSTTFTVSGQNLPSTLAFWIEECENLTSLGGSSTSRQFRCTPTWSIGWKEGVVKDQSGGTVLKEFSVYVSL